MSKVTISDFAIALFELAEAEAQALQDSARAFLDSERQSLETVLWRSSIGLMLAGAALFSLLVGLGFMSWGVYLLVAAYLSPGAAPFVTGGLWLCIGLGLGVAAAGRRRGDAG